jgi:hypothetical protein
MYVSFPLAGFDTSESATHYRHINLKSCEKNKIGLTGSGENQLLKTKTLSDYLYQPLCRLFEVTTDEVNPIYQI